MGIRSGMLRRMIWILVAPAAVWAVYAVWRAEAFEEWCWLIHKKKSLRLSLGVLVPGGGEDDDVGEERTEVIKHCDEGAGIDLGPSQWA